MPFSAGSSRQTPARRWNKNLVKSYCLFLFLGLIFVACTSSETDNTPVELPVSDTKPTLLVFCNNADVLCTDLGYITENLTAVFGEDSVSIAYIFVDSGYGARVFNMLELSDMPSFVIFSPEEGEVFRSSGEVNIDELISTIANILRD